MAERLGCRGMGVAAQLAVNLTTAPFKRNSAFGDHPYSLGIGPSSFVAPAAIASNSFDDLFSERLAAFMTKRRFSPPFNIVQGEKAKPLVFDHEPAALLRIRK